jgi:hypothetical protein
MNFDAKYQIFHHLRVFVGCKLYPTYLTSPTHARVEYKYARWIVVCLQGHMNTLAVWSAEER